MNEKKINYDPFRIIKLRKFNSVPKGKNPLSDAVKSSNNHFQPKKIEVLLNNKNTAVSTDGLLILSEMGIKGYCLVDAALMHVEHLNWVARFYLADTLLASNKLLTVDQIGIALKLCEDETLEVRCKMMEILSRLNIEDIEFAVSENTSLTSNNHYRIGMFFLTMSDDAIYQAKNKITSESFIERCFAGGTILKFARRNPCAITIKDGMAEEKYLSWQLDRLCKQFKKNTQD